MIIDSHLEDSKDEQKGMVGIAEIFVLLHDIKNTPYIKRPTS